MERNLLFFFSALGAFNGLLLAGYFLFSKRPQHVSSYLVAFFFLSLSIRIGKSVFYFFKPDLAPEFLQFGLTFCCFIGPTLYVYLRSVMRRDQGVKEAWPYHLGVIVPAMLIVGFMYPYTTHRSLWYDNGIIFVIYNLWTVYSVLAIIEIKSLFTKLFSRGVKLSSLEAWMISLCVGNALILLAYRTTGFTSYILGALLFSFMLYSVVMLLFRSSKKDPILVKPSSLKINNKPTKESQELLARIKEQMTSEELYLNSDLKLSDVASQLNVVPYDISKVLNEHYGHNFSHFLNEYRVDHAKTLILSDSPFTFEAIGYDSGFNSRSSFFATFKKFTGTTPAKFKKQAAQLAQ